MEKEEEKETIITVSDPQVRKEYGGAKQYYLYTIRGEDLKGPFQIQRRYSDFDSLRNLLVKRWPGCYVPSLPSKVKLSHSDDQFLETRSKYLCKFLNELSKRNFLWGSDQIQIFLRNKLGDFDKVISTFWKVQHQQLLYRYENIFKQVSGGEEKQQEEQIQSFGSYLISLLQKVQQLRNRSQQINNAQARYQRKYSKFLLNVLSSYEQKFLAYYNKKNSSFVPIFSVPQNIEKKNELEETLKEPPLKVLFEQLKREKRQIFALQQAVKGYEQYCKQRSRTQGKIKQHEIKIEELKNGKQSFLSKLKSIAGDNDIPSHEKSIQRYKNELKQLDSICKIIRIIMCKNEFEAFRQERTTSYYKMVQQIAREQLKIIEKQRQFWSAVSNSNSFGFQIQENNPNLKQKIINSEIKDVKADLDTSDSFVKRKEEKSQSKFQNQLSKKQKPEVQNNEQIRPQIDSQNLKFSQRQKDKQQKAQKDQKEGQFEEIPDIE